MGFHSETSVGVYQWNRKLNLYLQIYQLTFKVPSNLHLIKSVHCRCSPRTLYKGLDNHTAWSWYEDEGKGYFKRLKCYSMCFKTKVQSGYSPFKRAHLEELAHDCTLHLSEEKPCLREKPDWSILFKHTHSELTKKQHLKQQQQQQQQQDNRLYHKTTYGRDLPWKHQYVNITVQYEV